MKNLLFSIFPSQLRSPLSLLFSSLVLSLSLLYILQFIRYYIPEQGKLASWLVKNSPMDRVFFWYTFCSTYNLSNLISLSSLCSNSGAEANEAAIKLARKYAHTKLEIDDPVIITAVSSFHGRTLATITATGQPKYQKNFGPLVPGFEYVPYNDASALRAAVARINGKKGLLSRLKFWQKPKPRLAAILMEALQGEGGVQAMPSSSKPRASFVTQRGPCSSATRFKSEWVAPERCGASKT